MSENTDNLMINFVELASDIVCAYVTNNSVPSAELQSLIQGVHAALKRLANGIVQTNPEAELEKPSAARIRKSVTPEGIVSFLDGKTYQTMKRHLSGHGLDPHSYRQRFGLPADYPMVSASYATRRSELAKSFGLGRVADREEAPQPRGRARGKAA